MMERMRSVWCCISDRGRRWFLGVAGLRARFSTTPAITVKGVRSSWEALATKSRRIMLR